MEPGPVGYSAKAPCLPARKGDGAVTAPVRLRRGVTHSPLADSRSFGTMAGMLVIRAFDNSDAMTTAMTQRGYDGSLPFLRRARLSMAQVAGLAVFAAMATAAWSVQNWPR